MSRFPLTICLLFPALLLLSWSSLSGTEYFVSKDGSDQNAGISAEAAFATIQKGVDALTPGDTLTIYPGEYFETVTRSNLGSLDKKTRIQAKIPGTVLLRGDKEAPAMEKVQGLSRIYSMAWSEPVSSVNELDTLTLLEPMPNLRELEVNPGTYYYDAENQRLFLSTSDMESPRQHFYTISVNKEKNGIFLESPKGVIIQGLAVSGFNSSREVPDKPGKYSVWGMLLYQAQQCEIRNCIAFANGGGIAISSMGVDQPGRNLIEGCVAYGNYSGFGQSGGNIVVFGGNEDVIRDCVGYLSKENGVRFYSAFGGLSLLEKCLGWGNAYDIFLKGANDDKYGFARNVVAVGVAQVKNIAHSLVGGTNPYLAPEKTSGDNILLAKEKVNPAAEFADPVNFDYRLQSTSKFRGAGPNGEDRGPFPYQPTVFYVTPQGSDSADGLSMKTAWRTLGHALENLKAGHTLYLSEGIYSAGEVPVLSGSSQQVISVKARGHDHVIIEGVMNWKNSRSIHLERLAFRNRLSLSACEAISIRNCLFLSEEMPLVVKESSAIDVGHSVFACSQNGALSLTNSRDITLTSNIFNVPENIPAIFSRESEVLFSNYNSYSQSQTAWEIDGSVISLSNLPGSQDNSSREIRPQFEEKNQVLTLVNREEFFGKGQNGTSIGFHQPTLSTEVRMTEPRVYSVTDTTANIEWITSEKVECEIAWGDTPECPNSVTYEVDKFGTFSLTGLKPDTKYYFRIRSLTIPRTLRSGPLPAKVANPQFNVLAFQTSKDSKPPQTYYVSLRGNDENDGVTLGSAWRTVNKAATEAQPGDTVWIDEGTYSERVRIRNTGEKGKPISFRSLPGKKVAFDGGERLLENAWILDGKSFINIDGFYFDEYRMVGGGIAAKRIFTLYKSNDVTISRCFYDGRSRGYTPGFLTATDCQNLTVENCVVISGFNGAGIRRCENFRLKNCVFVRTMIQAMTIGSGDVPHYIQNNIFTDSSIAKVGPALLEWSGQNAIQEEANCYFLRVPDEQRKLFWMLSFEENGKPLGHTRMSLQEYGARVRPTTSVVADPAFPVLKKIEKDVIALEARKKEEGRPWFPVDAIFTAKPSLDFPDFFASNPLIKNLGSGLQPEQFQEFHFNRVE